MVIAVTDACIFIDLIELNLLHRFFQCGLNIHTTADVVHELFRHQQRLLNSFRRKGNLTIHTLSGAEQQFILSETFPGGLSHADRSVLLLSKKLNGAILLSGDRKLRKFAGKSSIECHGSIWIVERLVNDSLISPNDGVYCLIKLIDSNLIYTNSHEMKAEVALRISKWSSGNPLEAK